MVENQNSIKEPSKVVEELPSRTTTIKISMRVWDSLKRLKKENETFDDVIKEFLKERTKSIGDDNVKAIQYSRKVVFFNTEYRLSVLKKTNSIGVELEYNDVKNQKSDFILDVKIKKIFYGKRILNPSVFFGVDDAHKHYSSIFLNLYLKAVGLALDKEFRVVLGMYDNDDYEGIAKWRKIYYDYNLSVGSFKRDIEEPLRLSEEEKPTAEWLKRMLKSISGSMI